MAAKLKEWAVWCAGLLLLASGTAKAEYGINFPPPATSGAQDIYNVHMLTLKIVTVMLAIVTVIVAYSVWAHRKSRGATPDQHFHETWFGRWGWLLVPGLVLGIDLTIAGSAQSTLKKIWLVPQGNDMLDVKITGHQWWWQYDYIDKGIRIDSHALSAQQAGKYYLRAVDNPLVLPSHTKIRFLNTSADVLHSWWVPAIGFKKDAIPGYVTETWAVINKEGTYRGQCAELCGTWHAKMPVVVKVVTRKEFDSWVQQQKSAMAAAAAAANAAVSKHWTKAALMAKGKQAFETKCAACHQKNGEGLPPTFPPLKGSKVVLGPVQGHLKVVLEGRPGTPMPSWAGLSDLEIASIVTYERNSWGNDTGDVIQPKLVAAERDDIKSAAR